MKYYDFLTIGSVVRLIFIFFQKFQFFQSLIFQMVFLAPGQSMLVTIAKFGYVIAQNCLMRLKKKFLNFGHFRTEKSRGCEKHILSKKAYVVITYSQKWTSTEKYRSRRTF